MYANKKLIGMSNIIDKIIEENKTSFETEI